MNKNLQNNLSIIFDFAEKWAEGGGSKGIEMETFNEAKVIILAEIEKLIRQKNPIYDRMESEGQE